MASQSAEIWLPLTNAKQPASGSLVPRTCSPLRGARPCMDDPPKARGHTPWRTLKSASSSVAPASLPADRDALSGELLDSDRHGGRSYCVGCGHVPSANATRRCRLSQLVVAPASLPADRDALAAALLHSDRHGGRSYWMVYHPSKPTHSYFSISGHLLNGLFRM
jgi:hypothetical protein